MSIRPHFDGGIRSRIGDKSHDVLSATGSKVPPLWLTLIFGGGLLWSVW